MTDPNEKLKMEKAFAEAGIETDGQRLERIKKERKLKKLQSDELRKKHKHQARIERKIKRLNKNRSMRRKYGVLAV